MMPEIFSVFIGLVSSIKMMPLNGLISCSIFIAPKIDKGDIAIWYSGILYLKTFFWGSFGFKTRIYSAGKNPGFATTLFVKIWYVRSMINVEDDLFSFNTCFIASNTMPKSCPLYFLSYPGIGKDSLMST